MTETEELVNALWQRWGREVGISFVHGGDYPWTVMVEGDEGSYAGTSLIDALQHRLEGDAPEFTEGWGKDAH